MSCVICGSEDRFGYSFCTSCGEVYPARERGAYAPPERGMKQNTKQQLDRNMAIALFFILMTMVLMAMYLSFLGTQWELVILVESFPLFWFFVVLMHWRKSREDILTNENAK